MKSNSILRSGGKSVLAVVTMLLGGVPIVSAQPTNITFSGPVTLFGDSDVATNGTLVAAYDYYGGPGTVTVNGVPFVGSFDQTALGANFLISGIYGSGANYTYFTSPNAPWSGLSSSYQAMISGGVYTSYATAVTVTITNLAVGHQYLVQYWVSDPRNTPASQTETVMGGNTVTLQYNSTGSSGGVGQYTIGTFTASAPAESFTVQASGSAASTYMNAIQLRDLGAAGGIVFSAPVTISGDSDVATNGTSVAAYDLNGSSGNVTVNGVSFVGSTSSTALGANVLLSGFPSSADYFGFTSSSAPWSGLSSSYQAVLSAGDNTTSPSVVTVTVTNLTVGDQYLVQYWVSDPRNTPASQTETVVGENAVTLQYNSLGSSGGVGQYTIGTFTANANVAAFTIQGAGTAPSTYLNAIQLRDLGANNVGYWNGAAGSVLNYSSLNFCTNLYSAPLGVAASLTAVAALGNACYFGDVYYSSGIAIPVTATNLTVAAGGISIGTLSFVNDNNTYTVGSSDTNGITGGTLLVKQGTGGVILAGNNRYSGGTLINTGTLQVGNGGGTGTLGSGAVTNNGTLVYDLNGNVTVSNMISGAGSVVQEGGGTLTLPEVNTYTGTTTVSNGTLAIDGSAVMANDWSHSDSYVIESGATLRLQSTNASQLRWQANAPLIAGAGAFLRTGSAYLYFANGASAVTFEQSSGGLADFEGGTSSYFEAAASNLGGLTVNNATVGSQGNVYFDALNGNGTLSNNGAGMLTVGVNNGNGLFSGVIADGLGQQSLAKTGTGTEVLSGTNTYSGSTAVNGGTLLVNGSLAADATVAGGAILGGTGMINRSGNGVVQYVSGTIAPGNGPSSIGTLTVGGVMWWETGGSYLFEMNNATNSAGWDQLNMNLLYVDLGAGNQFTVKLASLTASNTPGPVAGFNAAQSYSWPIATASGGVAWYSQGRVIVDASAFSNVYNGTFSVTLNGNTFDLNYTPTPIGLSVSMPTTNQPATLSGAPANGTFTITGPLGYNQHLTANGSGTVVWTPARYGQYTINAGGMAQTVWVTVKPMIFHWWDSSQYPQNITISIGGDPNYWHPRGVKVTAYEEGITLSDLSPYTGTDQTAADWLNSWSNATNPPQDGITVDELGGGDGYPDVEICQAASLIPSAWGPQYLPCLYGSGGSVSMAYLKAANGILLIEDYGYPSSDHAALWSPVHSYGIATEAVLTLAPLLGPTNSAQLYDDIRQMRLAAPDMPGLGIFNGYGSGLDSACDQAITAYFLNPLIDLQLDVLNTNVVVWNIGNEDATNCVVQFKNSSGSVLQTVTLATLQPNVQTNLSIPSLAVMAVLTTPTNMMNLYTNGIFPISLPQPAGRYIWTGAGNNSTWSTAANWRPNGPPAGTYTSGNYGYFDGTITNAGTVSMPSGNTSISNVTLVASASGSSGWTLDGNATSQYFTSYQINSSGSGQANTINIGAQTISSSVPLIFNVADGNTVNYNGLISKSGGVTLTGGGALALNYTPNTYTGPTIISNGVVKLESTYYNGNDWSQSSSYYLGAGGSLALDSWNGSAYRWQNNAPTINGPGYFRRTGTAYIYFANAGTGKYVIFSQAAGGLAEFVGGTSSYLKTSTTNLGSLSVRSITSGATVVDYVGDTYFDAVYGDGVFQNVGTSGTLNLGMNNGGDNFSGVISDGAGGAGTQNLAKWGSGTQTLSGIDTYTGTTTVNGGTLLVNGQVGNGTVTVKTNATLGGSGSIGGTVTLQRGGRLEPGGVLTTGTLATGAETWSNNCVLVVNLASATNSAQESMLSVNGTLTMTAATSFTVKLVTLSANNTAGVLPDFNPTQNYTWTVASATSLSGFNAAHFQVDPTAFSNAYAGVFYVTNINNTIAVKYMAGADPLPAVELTSPTNGQYFTASMDIPLSANVKPNGHFISQVQYFNNTNTLVGTSATGPDYSVTWPAVSAGGYNLTAVATYETGSVTSPPPVSGFVLGSLNLGGGAKLGGGSFQLTFSGTAGQPYRVVGTNLLTAPLATWPVLGSGTIGADGSGSITDPTPATNQQWFYRVVSP